MAKRERIANVVPKDIARTEGDDSEVAVLISTGAINKKSFINLDHKKWPRLLSVCYLSSPNSLNGHKGL